MAQLLLAAGLLIFPVAGLAWLLPPVGSGALALAAPVTFAAVAILAATGMRANYPHDELGLCNLVTLMRAGLSSVLTVPVLLAFTTDLLDATWWSVLAIAVVAFALDGLDGWLARSRQMVSAFGARFDMEVDAFLAFLLAILAVQGGKAGFWVLALGLMRYAFVAASYGFEWLGGALPDSMRRKRVSVIQIAVLIALLSPAIVPPVSVALAAGASVLLAWSFAVDVVWLYRHRR